MTTNDLTASDRRAVVLEILRAIETSEEATAKTLDAFALSVGISPETVASYRDVKRDTVLQSARAARHASDEELADILVGAQDDGGEE